MRWIADPVTGLWQVSRRVEIARSIRAGMPENAANRLDHFRWRNDDGDESSTGATFAESEDTNHTVVGGADSDFVRRLRIAIDQTNVLHDQGNTITARLEAKLNTGGTWAAVPSSSGTYIEMYPSSGLAQGTQTTDHGLTKSFTWLNGEQEETDADADQIPWTSVNGEPPPPETTICEWAFKCLAAGLADTDVIHCRLTNAGTLFDTYDFGDASDTNPITITVTGAAAAAFPPFARRQSTTVRM